MNLECTKKNNAGLIVHIKIAFIWKYQDNEFKGLKMLWNKTFDLIQMTWTYTKIRVYLVIYKA